MFTIFYQLTACLQTKKLEAQHNWFLTDCGWSLNEKVTEFRTQFFKSCKDLPENISDIFIC